MKYHIVEVDGKYGVAQAGEDTPCDSELFDSAEAATPHLDELTAKDTEAKGGIDLDAWTGRVYSAVRAMFPSSPYEASEVWAERVYDDAVIISAGQTKWRAPYTMDGETVTFAPVQQWTEVEMTYVPVGAGANDNPVMEVKALADGRIRGYALLWGDENNTDLSEQKDYFTPHTDFWDKDLPMPRPLTYHHGWNAETKSYPVIGKIDEIGDDEVGRWYIAELDKAHRYEKGVRALLAQRALRSSVDSIPQYARREAKANGAHEIKVYPLFGVTLTPMPAEPRLVERPMQEMKSLYQSIGVELTLPETPAETDNRAGVASAKPNDAKTQADQMVRSQEAKGMNEQELTAFLDKRDKEQKAAAEAKAAEEKRIEDLAEAKAQVKLTQMAKDRGLPIFPAGGSRISVASKYDGMKLEDLSFLAVVRQEAKAIGKSRGVDELLARALAARSIKAVEQGKLEAKALDDLFGDMPIEAKSNEVMQSTLATAGDEWVPTNYGSQLWMLVRAKARLLQNGFIPEQEIPKGYESDTIPLESSTDFTFYNVAQAANEDGTMKIVPATVGSSKMGTGSRVITVGKAGARGYISGELDEDSIIDAIPEARAKLERQLPPEIEFLLFNMDDTTATDNINGDGTPVSGADYTIGKGIIRNALKNNTAANAVDWSAAITSAKLIALYNLVGADGYLIWDDPTASRGFADYLTWSKMMGLSDLLTVANAGPEATIRNGVDADGGIPIFGVRWYPSTGVKKAQATGIRHGTEASNTKGRAVLVRGDQWKLRWKRRPKFETSRVPEADLTQIVVTLRLGIGYYDTEASAIAYNCA